MNCREAQKLFSARIDGELSALEWANLDAHLETCPPCAEGAKSMASTVLMLRTLPPTRPDPMFVGRVLDKVRGYEAELAQGARVAPRSEPAAVLSRIRRWWAETGAALLPAPIPLGAALVAGGLAGFVFTRDSAQDLGGALATLGGRGTVKESESRSEGTGQLLSASQRPSPYTDLIQAGVLNGPSAPIRGASGLASPEVASVEVLAPEWWAPNAPDTQLQQVGTLPAPVGARPAQAGAVIRKVVVF
ncbi:MAG: zf-HC2 domain-containing protein [Candidatus Eisenbacteria bacterium]|nr:zf-HC2 domain-containing protein [Candidatus Eisenbacteria bacterium]MCC7143155.1 zf-HC2 domain-containing protein [Candidatus Eisenbacteria bacterium]